MKRRFLFNFLTCAGMSIALFICGFAAGTISEQADAAEPVTITQVEERIVTRRVEVPAPAKVVEIVKEVPRQTETLLTQGEKELIASVVYAEANNQDMLGKRLIVDTILNRKDNERFPNTVYGVVYQEGQYHRSAGVYNDECLKAIEMEIYERLDYDVYWFNNDGYLPYGTPAYRHGDHYFSWEEL